jgi:hypothetical protein
MGRVLPELRISETVQSEIALARTVDEAVARVAPRTDLSLEEEAAVLDEVLGQLDSGPDAGLGAQPSTSRIGGLQFVFLDGLEVTQVVQDLTHTVPLIAQKTTIVRAYLRYALGPVEVRGELRIAWRPHGPWLSVPSLGTAQLDPSRSGQTLAALRSRRADLAFSLNFRLPPNLASRGQMWLRLGKIRRATGTPLPSLAGLTSRTVMFQPPAPLRLRLVRIRYTMGNPPVTHEPAAIDAAYIASWLRRAYPIARLDLTTTTVTATPTPPFLAAQINAQLIALRAVDVSTGTDARTHYYGMVADSGFFMRGRAAGIPQTPQPDVVASGPTGPGTFGWDNDGSYGDWMGGHELGHTLGRFHAEFCGALGGAPYPFQNGQLSDADEAFVGIDVGDPVAGLPMRVLGGVDSHDVMSYCDDQWLSSFTYIGVHDRVVDEDALPAGADVGPTMASAMKGSQGAGLSAMRVIAALNLTDRSGTISSILPTDVGGGAPVDEAGEHQILIRVLDAGGSVLDERPAAFRRSACEEPDEDVTGVVDVDIPPVAGAASIELVVDGQVVDSQLVGGDPTVGALAAPNLAAAGPGETSGDVELRWEAPGAPASQRYIVQVSDDDGSTWRTVAVSLPEPVVKLPSDEVTGDELTVRILATTGTGTSVVRTDRIRVR